MNVKTLYVAPSLKKIITICGKEVDITSYQPEIAGFLPVFHNEKDAVDYGNGLDAICIKTVEPDKDKK